MWSTFQQEKRSCQEVGKNSIMASSQGMLLQVIIMLIVLVVVWSSAASASSVAPAKADLKKHGCIERCGDLDIPYPFGVEENCYFDSDFLINCSDSKPYLRKSLTPVSNISLETSEIRVRRPVARDCYNRSGGNNNISSLSTSYQPEELRLVAFSVSNTKNKFTAIGCDTRATVQLKGDNYSVATGCESQCSSFDSIPKGPCSGIGCCQTSIPEGVGYMNIRQQSYNNVNNTNVWTFNPCSYAFVVEESVFNFSSSDFSDFKEERMQMVLDWAIGKNMSCEEAKRDGSYECGDNSDCYAPKNGPGYLCKCDNGYEGNPYLSDGCQEIDECADPNRNKCEERSKCFNTPAGNYTCSCPKGYHGDGRTDGKGCIANRFLVIQIVIGVAIGATVVLVSSSWLYWIFKKRKLIMLKEKFFRQNGGLMLQQQLSRQERSTQEVVKIFTSEDLKRATNNYDESRIVGRGGYGTVYKGFLADNRIVAIKKSQMVDESQIEQFINEVVVLSQINHRNVVRLLGCCLETQVPLLVYEFITNGTLFDHIHNESKSSTISWETRLQIAAEISGVLSYLHYATSIPILHRDVKSTNILLDDNYTAKVSDFGASRLVLQDQNQLATMMHGTLGYLDPEYMLTSQLTEKSDVYSFGVVLVELITGKKALSFQRPEEERSLAMYFLSSMKNDHLFQIIDEHIVIEGNTKELQEVANLAKRCLKLKGDERPTMKEVAMELEGLIIKKTEKHLRLKNDMNFEETEYLLGQVSMSNEYEFGGCSSNITTTGYDRVREHIILSFDGGR